MHGLEVLRFVRRHPLFQTLPVLVLTTRGDEASCEHAMAAGATIYLTKPFVPSALADQVRALLTTTASVREQEQRGVDPS
jgi:DNA-binding response OmpR family regulator